MQVFHRKIWRRKKNDNFEKIEKDWKISNNLKFCKNINKLKNLKIWTKLKNSERRVKNIKLGKIDKHWKFEKLKISQRESIYFLLVSIWEAPESAFPIYYGDLGFCGAWITNFLLLTCAPSLASWWCTGFSALPDLRQWQCCCTALQGTFASQAIGVDCKRAP